ncbi:MAG: alpha-amylase family glycosyl hydrolase [Propionibacteriaceae bacterium]|nr:alpha-amylase family glycosyl hydrolase [Propionibacteriaceae bacterium]
MNARILAKAMAVMVSCALALTSCATPTPSVTPIPASVDQYRNYYEIFVGSFADSNGDGIGDLAGITSKLEYIRGDVGADGIWLTPINPSPSYHKYDVTDYVDLDPQFGTMDDFRAFMAKAHELGIWVLLDLVIQHTSSQHPWFLEAVEALQAGTTSKYINYFYFSREPQPGYTQYEGTDIYYTAAFTADMPDLNLGNPRVRDELADIVAFWMNEGVDGFRLDATTWINPQDGAATLDFLNWLNETCKEINPDAYLVGEAWTGGDQIASYFSSGVQGFFNFPFAGPEGTIHRSISAKEGGWLSVATAEWNARIHEANPNAIDAAFISNHDTARSAGYLMRSLPLQKLTAATYLLLPGNPFIYYGEEVGMVGSGNDPNKRMPMVWSATDLAGITAPPPEGTYDQSDVTAVDEQLKDPDSLLNFYRAVLAIKAKHPGIARGTYTSLQASESAIYASRSDYQGESVYVFINFSDVELKQNLADVGAESVTLAHTLLPAADGQTPSLADGTLTLPPLSVAIMTAG